MILALAWTSLYGWRAYVGHRSLLTNAYDLSVFDYALWNLLHGRLGFVPFMGHSIFSHHFMPILLLLMPVYALSQGPAALIAIQTVAQAGAGLVFLTVARRLGLRPMAALALMFALLLSRRSHGAEVSYFYPESLQPLLMFSLVWAWLCERWRVFWIVAVLLLMTKEDMPLYLGAFAALQWIVTPRLRRHAAILGALAALWLIAAFAVAIPLARHLDGLGAANPFFEARFGAVDLTPGGISGIGERFVSLNALRAVGSTLASAGLLSLAAPSWLLVAAPALALSMALAPGSGQAAILGHYAFPILPWVFLSAAAGVERLSRRWPRVTMGLLLLLVAATIADSPALRSLRVRADPDAVAVLQRLPELEGQVVAVQPNLIPHLPHTNRIRTLEPAVLDALPDEVLLTTVGDLWPLRSDDVLGLIARFRGDQRYETVENGPLFVFRRRDRPIPRR